VQRERSNLGIGGIVNSDPPEEALALPPDRPTPLCAYCVGFHLDQSLGPHLLHFFHTLEASLCTFPATLK